LHDRVGIGVGLEDRRSIGVVWQAAEIAESIAKIVGGDVDVGIDVELDGVIWVGDAMGPGDPPAWHYTLVDYRARMIGGTLEAADDAEEVAWVPLGKVLDLPLTPTMPDLLAALLDSLSEGNQDDIG